MRWVVGFLLFSSCVANNSLETWAQSEQNADNIVRLNGGMSAEEVMHIMHQPYRIETYQIGEDSYEAWFYITRATVIGQKRPIHTNLTPLILKDGVLIGRGYDYYRWLLRKQEDFAHEQRLHPSNEEREDQKIEKTLEVTMSKPPQKNPPPEPDPKSESPLKPEDEDRLEQESDQNFNFW